MATEGTSGLRSISHAWRALRHRNFQLFFAGQSISLIGTWMTRLATVWLVYHLTHSALMLGVVSVSGNIITFLLAPVAGVLIEGVERRRLIVWTQIAAGLQSLALAVLTLTNVITIHEVIALAALQGLINSFDMPARQSFIVQMVGDREDLSNAIAINSSMVNGARLVGPAIAGFVIALVGTGYCFLIDAMSYIAVVISLLLMRIEIKTVKHPATLLEQLREGWEYVSKFRPTRSILLLFGLVGLMGYPYTVLLPIFATKILHGDATTLGWLTGASGAGAFISAVSLALRKSVLGLGRNLQLAAGIFGAALMLFGLSHQLWSSLLCMLGAGFGMTQCMAIANTLIQTMVPEEKRARVMGYYTMTFFASMPLGSLLAGFLAQQIGAPHTVMITGAFCIAGCIWFAFELPAIRELVRPIYLDLGIIERPPLEAETT